MRANDCVLIVSCNDVSPMWFATVCISLMPWVMITGKISIKWPWNQGVVSKTKRETIQKYLAQRGDELIEG